MYLLLNRRSTSKYQNKKSKILRQSWNFVTLWKKQYSLNNSIFRYIMCEDSLIFIDIHIFKYHVKSLSMKNELQWPTTRIFHFDGWYVQNNVGVNEIQHLSSPPDFSEVRVARSLVFCVVFCRSLFIFWGTTVYCLSFDLRLLIASFVSLNYSLKNMQYICWYAPFWTSCKL